MHEFFEGETELQSTLKWFVLAGVGYYLYKVTRSNGGSLKGNSSGYKVSIDGEGLVDALMPLMPGKNQEVKMLMGMGAKRIVRAMQARGNFG